MHLSIFFTVSFILAVYCLPLNAQWLKDTSIGTQYIEALYAYEDKLYAGSDIVVYIKTGSAAGWEETAPLPAASGAGVSTIFRTGNRLFAGTWGYGIFESTDNGAAWVPRNNGIGTSYGITCLVQRDNNLYTGTSGNGVFRMDLNSVSAGWTTFRNGLPFNTGAWDVYSIYNYGGTLFAGAGQSGYIYFNDSVSDPWYDNEFAGPGQSGLAMWSFISQGSVVLGGASDGIYRSTDDGATWDYHDPVLGNINNVKFAANGEKVFTALTIPTYGTIIYSTADGGINWIFEDNLPGVLTLDFTFFSDHLYIAAFDGIWYKPLNPSSIADDNMVPSHKLHQNHPNPFNPATILSFVIGNPSFVSLKVYDILGNEVAILVNEYKPAGNYSLKFNAADLTSGVYFYQLSIGSPSSSSGQAFVETRKMIVVK